jgi:hypothetical protein
MTQLDTMYRYGLPPGEATGMALGKVREVYGIRNLTVDEAAHTVRVEFDASRLTEAVVFGLLRRTGLDLQERVSLIPDQPPAEPAVTPAIAK